MADRRIVRHDGSCGSAHGLFHGFRRQLAETDFGRLPLWVQSLCVDESAVQCQSVPEPIPELPLKSQSRRAAILMAHASVQGMTDSPSLRPTS